MALTITDDHRQLADSVARVLQDRQAIADTRLRLGGDATGAAPSYWRDAGELGWFGLLVPETHGGSGASLEDVAVLHEQLGAHVAAGSALLASVAAAVLTTDDEFSADFAAALCAGDSVVALALGDPLEAGPGNAVTGRCEVAFGGTDALVFLVADGEDILVVDASAGVAEASPLEDTIDVSVPLVSLAFTQAPIRLTLKGAAAQARRLVWLLAAAQAAGGIRACLERTIAYVSVREQFGRPVGSFQAVKHHCADMMLASELASAAVWGAARVAPAGDVAMLAAAQAATIAVESYVSVAQQAIQLRGGIGYTWEDDAHLYLRRATLLASLVDAPDGTARTVSSLRGAGHRATPTVALPETAEGFRRQAREFLATYRAAPPERRQAVAARAGYVVPHWPAPYGRGADAVEQLVIEEELAELPRQSLGLGEWVLPTILQYGTDEQRERWMWRSLDGELRWCQLFSEPGAGSDAAAVSTRAVPVAGGWRLTGQKVWTSEAHICQWGLATVRTDPDAPKHRGITAMAVDVHAPGVEVRPLTEITGESLFNEVFLDDVFVPDSDVIGAVNDGWRVARATLANERLSIGSNPITVTADALLELRAAGLPATTSHDVAVGGLLSEAYALQCLNAQQLFRALSGAEPGVEGNIAKLVGAEHAQHIVNLGMRINRGAAVGNDPRWVHDYLFARCLTIAGGTSEVVRTQIAERILDLPRAAD